MRRRGFVAVSVVAALGLLGMCQAAVAARGTAPTIERQWVTGITSSDAVLHARIDPNGEHTGYRFQIDTTGRFRFSRNDGCLLHLRGVMCTQAVVRGDPLPPGIVVPPEAAIQAGPRLREVRLRLSSIGTVLTPGETYHYRVVAASSPARTVEGPRRVFVAGGQRCAPLPCWGYSKRPRSRAKPG
jgi:hypothetical protein